MKLKSDVTGAKLQALEKMLGNVDNVKVVEDLQKRVKFLEDNSD